MAVDRSGRAARQERCCRSKTASLPGAKMQVYRGPGPRWQGYINQHWKNHMNSFVRHGAALATVLVLLGSALPLHAQSFEVPRKNVISANPFGLLLEFFNGEYERVVSESSTAGVGGSYFTDEDVEYVNADAFFRFYPQGDPLNGWAFGGKAGVTSIDEVGTYFGFGFDVNRSWLLGRNNNFYVGVGFGLKRLLGVSDEDDPTGDLLKFIPTIRIVNVGFAF